MGALFTDAMAVVGGATAGGLPLMEVTTRQGGRVAVSLSAGRRLTYRGALEGELPFDPGEEEDGGSLRTLALAALCAALPRLDPARVSAPGEADAGRIDAVLDAVRVVSGSPDRAVAMLRPGALAALLARAGWARVPGPPGLDSWASPDGARRAAHPAQVAGVAADAPATWAALCAVAEAHGIAPQELLVALLAGPEDVDPPRAARLSPRRYRGPDPRTCCGRGCDDCAFDVRDGWECDDCGVVGPTPAEVAHGRGCPGARP